MMKKAVVLVLLLVMAMGANAATITPTPEPDDETMGIDTQELDFVLEAAEGQEIDPPITLELPDDWLSANSTVAIQDVFGLQLVPFTVYAGPVTGGEGFIIVLWGYESTGTFNPITQESNVSPYLDALRLFRLAIIGGDCVPGVDVQQEFSVGDEVGIGANFSAYRCEATLDTRGWFVGLEVDGVNMGIYVYTEPIDVMDGIAPQELQAILDSAEFDVDGLRVRLRERAEAIRAEIELTGTPPAPTVTATPAP
ncbi:MAG: hypothetical protein EA396_01660 [Anaerolineaceae bacterium]|nr:MAG: hypothetical protein EA396_01660 [Anaerolineaceae bacterium]